MSERTLRTWKREAEQPPRRLGRPPHDARARFRALLEVRRELRAQGHTVGERAVLQALAGRVPRTLVRESLKRWKARFRKRGWAERERLRQSVVPIAPNVLASLDGAWVGTLERSGMKQHVKAELIRDVASQVTAVPVVGLEIGGAQVVAVLEAWTAAHGGEPPLALATDNGPENVNADVRAWCEARLVVHVKNVPHTPQHNPWAERAWRELKAETGLDAKVPIASAEAAAWRLRSAAARLNRGRLRATLGYRTAVERDREAPVRYTPAQREALYEAARAAAGAAWDACEKPRARPRAVREAQWTVLEEFGLVTRTRGGLPLRHAVPAGFS